MDAKMKEELMKISMAMRKARQYEMEQEKKRKDEAKQQSPKES